MRPERSIRLPTAVCLVVANMIGTGVFTSLGFQIPGLPSPWILMALWLLGGICSWAGALTYGELGAAIPRSGGEYQYLSVAYHPAVGFMSGWVSLLVGFSAPVALAAMAFGRYFHGALPHASPEFAAQIIVLLIAAVHLSGNRTGSLFQNTATLLKVFLIVFFILAGWILAPSAPVDFTPRAKDAHLLFHPDFAVSLIYVMYAYTGWNASTYIAGEMRHPERDLPLSIAIGTAFVTLLYLGLNATFLRTTPVSEMAGKLEVGQVAALHIFGPAGGRLMAAFICAGLVSSISAMTWVGPRVTMAMGEDFPFLSALGRKNQRGVPFIALAVQTLMVLLLLATRSFESVLTYLQCALTLCSLLTVLAVFVLRIRRPQLPRPYKTWGYPITPLLFLAVNLWMLCHVVSAKPIESLTGLATLLLGLVVFAIGNRPFSARKSSTLHS
jgi:APA family basic amino acid/polyamine antiporter